MAAMHPNTKEKFEEICELIKSIDVDEDAIVQTMKLRTVSEMFRSAVKDEKHLG